MKARLGAKLRGLRRRKGLTQTEVASRLGISPSYLNLIEHDQRQVPANLLLKAAEVLNVELAAFSDDTDGRLAADLQEVFGDPLFGEHPLTTADVRELAEHPSAARAMIALYHAYRASVESTRALASKVYDGHDFAGVNPAHFPSEEVSDVLQVNLNYFPELEAAAEPEATKIDRNDIYRSMADHLLRTYKIDVRLVPIGRDRGAVRRFDPEKRTLLLSEVLPPWSRNFQVAHQIGVLAVHNVIDSIIARSQQDLTTAESVKLCRVALANYFAAALPMPDD